MREMHSFSQIFWNFEKSRSELWDSLAQTFGDLPLKSLLSVASFQDILRQTGVQRQILVWRLYRVPQLSENVSREQGYCILSKLIIFDLHSSGYDLRTPNFQQSAEHPK